MTRWLAAGLGLIVAAAAVLLALDGTLNQTSRHDATVAAALHPGHDAARSGAHTRTTTTSTATTPTTPTLTPERLHPTGPAATHLRRALDRALAPAGPHVSVLVFDLSTHTELYGVHAGVSRPPASVEKLWTTTALMDRLGPHTRLHTTILGTGHERHGVWHGNLYLRGGGDPTFGDAQFNSVWNHGEGSTSTALVAGLRRRGIRKVTGRVYADESLFDRRRGGLITHYKPDIPDFGGQLSALTYDHGTTLRGYTPATFAVHEVVLTMRDEHIAATAARHARKTPRAARELASVASPTMQAMVRLMDVPSDDFFAELFAKQLGVLFGKGGTISDGARVIARTIADDYALHPTILDGSGLGRADRTSPVQIVDLLRDLWRTHVGRELTRALPTVGVNGTVAGIADHTAAARHCVAKTGSLDYVTNLAGYCGARRGQELAFGIFLDGPDNAEGFALEGQMVAAIARY